MAISCSKKEISFAQIALLRCLHLVVFSSILFISVPAAADTFSTNSKMADVGFGLGLPNLIAFDIAAYRLYPVSFGFGLGSIPAEALMRRRAGFDPDEYRQSVDEYTIIPSFALNWKTFKMFVRWHVTESFYLQGFYAVWNIHGSFSAAATGGQIGTGAIRLGSVNLTLAQPMIGLSTGWRWFFHSGNMYFDLNGGVLQFKRPHYSVSTYTAADQFSAAIPPDVAQQINEAKMLIRTEVDEGMKKYHEQLKYGPVLGLGMGFII
jgi:hypothetical protein